MDIEVITGITLFVMFLVILIVILYLLYGYVTEVDDKIDETSNKFVSKSIHEKNIDDSKKEDKVLHARIDNTFDGKYESLTGKPELFDKSYNSLVDKPVLFDGKYDSLEGKPDLFDKSYNSLTDKPVLFDGRYESLTGDKSNHMHTTDQITGLDDYFDNKYPDISSFRNMIDSKAPISHEHDYLGINGLSEKLAGKAEINHKHTMEDLELSKNPSYKLDINGNARFGRTEIYEENGTWGGGNDGGSLVLRHGNEGGASSIAFKSAVKSDTGDGAFIRYQDTLTNGGPGKRSRLVIGVTNDKKGVHKDDILLQPSGGVGIGVDDPKEKLHVNGSLLVEGDINGLTPKQIKYLATTTPEYNRPEYGIWPVHDGSIAVPAAAAPATTAPATAPPATAATAPPATAPPATAATAPPATAPPATAAPATTAPVTAATAPPATTAPATAAPVLTAAQLRYLALNTPSA